MPGTEPYNDELIAQGAELMARVTAIARTLSAELSALPLESVVRRARSAIHVASMGVTVGQCLSWLTDDRQEEVVAGMMELLRSMRVLLRGTGAVADETHLPPELGRLQREVDAYRQKVVEGVWGLAGIVPFRHALR